MTQTYSMKVNAINAARRFMAEQALSGDWNDHFAIDCIGPRQFVVQHKQPMNRADAWQSLMVATEGAFAFPTAALMDIRKGQQAAAAAFFASRPAPEPLSDGEYEAYQNERSAQDEAEDEEAFANAQKNADAQANDEQANAAPGSKYPAGWVHKSAIEKPVKRVWAIADEMIAENPEVTRAEVQAECVRRGIATGTARTQYQAWFSARRAAIENAARAAELSKKFNS